MKTVSSEHIRFGKRLREFRLINDMTQETLAAKADVDRSYIGFLERGESNPSLTLILKLAKILSVKPDELLKEIR
jgi:transcriptional regulator with XRE-family HTH domain